MGIPRQILTIVDPGIPKGRAVSQIPLIVGTGDTGSTTTIQTITSPTEAYDTYGEGPIASAIAFVGRYGGFPVRALRLATGTAGASGAVTRTGSTGPAMTVTVGTAKNRYSVRFEVTGEGALGTGRVRYSLDNWGDPQVPITWSDEMVVPVSGTIVLTGSGLEVDFAAGTLTVGELYDFTTTAPEPNEANLDQLSATLIAYTLPWRFLLLANDFSTAAEANTAAVDLDAVMTDLFDAHKHRRAVMGASRDTAANVGASALVTTFTSIRVSPLYGEAQTAGIIPLIGQGYPMLPVHVVAAARIARSLISTDPARVGSGPLAGVLGITHDEYVEQDLDDLKIGTLRTWPGLPGFYVTNAWIKSTAGSDYRYYQHGSVMDVACDVVYQAQARYIGAGLRTISGGTLAPEDGATIEADVRAQLNLALVEPLNAEGRPGHVSALEYDVSLANNVLATETLVSDLGVQPLGYPKVIETTIGMRIIGGTE